MKLVKRQLQYLVRHRAVRQIRRKIRGGQVQIRVGEQVASLPYAQIRWQLQDQLEEEL